MQEQEEKEILSSKTITSDIASAGKSMGISEQSRALGTANENTVWNQIRKSLREEFGEAIDTVWFSKAVAVECKDTKTLTLTMSTRFMTDWLKNNYAHVIRRVAGSVGVQRVEYGY